MSIKSLSVSAGPEHTTPQKRRRAPRARSNVATPELTTRELLRIVRASQPIPRVAVARRLGVHRRRVTVLVKPLLDSGVLREGNPERAVVRRVGRPAIGLSLQGETKFLMGVNIGVSEVKIAVATVDGRVLSEESFATALDPSVALAEIRAGIERLRGSLHGQTLAAVGISVAGPTDVQAGRLLYAPHLGWRNVSISAELKLDAPVIVENNATAAAIYEAQRRRGRRSSRQSDFVLVRAGTGIGVGLVTGGEVFRGPSSADIAGEFGHMTIVAGGKACACGNFGCWERYASAACAVELYIGDSRRATARSLLRFDDVVKKAVAGDRRAQVTLERVGTHLGIGIANVIGGLGIPDIIVSGELVRGWQFIETPARTAIGMSLAGRLSHWSLEAGDSYGAELGGALEVAIEHYLLSIVTGRRAAA